jgi:hypothetical protein
MRPSVNTVDVLRDGRARLVEPGVWAQGAAFMQRGRDCAGTAILAGCRKWNDPLVDVASAYLESAIPAEFRDLLQFNDAPETTLADILALYDRAIALAEADLG